MALLSSSKDSYSEHSHKWRVFPIFCSITQILNSPTSLFSSLPQRKADSFQTGVCGRAERKPFWTTKHQFLNAQVITAFYIWVRQSQIYCFLKKLGKKKITPLFLTSQILVWIATGLKLLFSSQDITISTEKLFETDTHKKKTNPQSTFRFKLCYNNNHQEMARLLSVVYLRHHKATSQDLKQVFTWSCPL